MKKTILSGLTCLLCVTAGVLTSCKDEKTEACDTAFADSLKVLQLRLAGREADLRERELDLMEREHAVGINKARIFPEAVADGNDRPMSSGPRLPISNDEAKAAYRKSRSAVAGQFPEGTERGLIEEDVLHQTAWGKKVMLNEIYARHGFIFQDEALRKHFNGETWYKGTEKSLSRIRLTALERQNIAFINNN